MERHESTRTELLAHVLSLAAQELPPERLIAETAERLASAFGDVTVTFVAITPEWTTKPLYTTSEGGPPRALPVIPEALERLHRGPLVVPDVLDEPWLEPARAVLASRNVRSAVDVPLRRNGELVAVMWFNTSEPRRWTDDEVRTLTEVAEQLAVVLERSEAREQREKGERILGAVSRSAQHFLTGAGVDAPLYELLAALGEATGAGIAYVFENVPGEGGAWPWCVRRAAWAPGEVPTVDDPRLGHTAPAPHWPRWAQALSRGEIVSGDVATLPDDEREVFELFGSRSFVAVPVFAGGTWWGFIGFEDLQEARVWSPSEVDALKTAATLVAAAVERATQEEQLHALFETTLEAIFITDDDHRYVDANPAGCEFLGVTRDELIGRDVADFLPEPARDGFERHWAEFRAAGPQRAEWVTRRADGTTRVAEASTRPNFLPGRHIAVLRDVTERRRLEAELLNAQKLESLGRLAGGIAHDFNNLLTGITGYASLLLERAEDDELLAHDAGEIKRAAERAAELTRQLLAFGRRQVLTPQALDLNTVVRDVAPLLERLGGPDVTLELRLAEGLPAVLADAGQVEQVVVNLAVNARDAMPGGGTLAIETRDARGEVELVVSDTGTGMDEATAARIFEPFFTTRDHGVGLGLASVYGIVTQSGGEIGVETAPGAGATFTIRLPRIEARPSGQQRAEAVPAERGTETILLVEDEDVVRDLARRVLERQGYTVLACADGAEAVARSGEHDGRIDLLLTDVVMPGLRGWDVARLVTGARPEVRVLYMSGYAEDALAGRPELEIELIEKPFAVEVLARRVRDALDGPAPLAYAADSASAL